MGSEDEVVGCIVEGKVKGDGEQRARQPIIMQCKERLKHVKIRMKCVYMSMKRETF